MAFLKYYLANVDGNFGSEERILMNMKNVKADSFETIPFPSVFVTSEINFGKGEIKLVKLKYIFSLMKLYFSYSNLYLA